VCVMTFSKTFVRNISHKNKNSARYCHKWTQMFTWSTRYSHPILIKLEFSRQIFENSSYIKFHENLFSCSRVVKCGRTEVRTDMTKVTVASRKFANARSNWRCRQPGVCNRHIPGQCSDISGWPGKDLKKGSCLFKGYIPEENPRQDIRTAGNPLAPTALRYTNIFGKYSSLIIFPGIELLEHFQTIHVTSCHTNLSFLQLYRAEVGRHPKMRQVHYTASLTISRIT
jgi:hypothetical protein